VELIWFTYPFSSHAFFSFCILFLLLLVLLTHQ